MDNNGEFSIEELEKITAGTGQSYEEAKERIEREVGPLRPNEELSLDHAEEIQAGNSLGYEENKKRTEEALNKFKGSDSVERTEEPQIVRYSDEEIRAHLAGVKIDDPYEEDEEEVKSINY